MLFSHSYSLLFAETINEPLAKNTEIGTFGVLAVYIFFVISGYLITSSFIRKPNLKNFLINRILRIIPALFIVVLISAIILGALITKLSFLEYFSDYRTYLYIVRNILLYPVTYILPGVFENNIYPNAVNGSLWTLRLEFTLYLMVAILGFLKLLNNKFHIFIMLLIAIVFVFLLDNYSSFVQSLVGDNIYNMMLLLFKNGTFFIMGMIFYIMRDKIPFSNKLAIFALLILLIFCSTSFTYYILIFTLPYLVLYLAVVSNKVMLSFNKYGDFSYGIYIYAFPIQQLYIYLFYDLLNLVSFFLLSFITTLFFAVFSWYIIEKPALSYKK